MVLLDVLHRFLSRATRALQRYFGRSSMELWRQDAGAQLQSRPRVRDDASPRYQSLAGGLRGGKGQRLCDVGHESNATGGPRSPKSLGLQLHYGSFLLGEDSRKWKGSCQSRTLDNGWDGTLPTWKERQAAAGPQEHSADCPCCTASALREAWGGPNAD